MTVVRSPWMLTLVVLFPAASHAGVLYTQTSSYPGNFNALTSQNQASGANYQSYDNFSLVSTGTVQSITWQGFYWDPRGSAFNPPAPNTTSFQIGFFANQNNLPGSLIGSAILLTNVQSAFVGTAAFGPDNFGNLDTVDVMNFSADLATGFTATGGQTYWLSIVSFASSYPPAWLWTSGTGGDGISAQLNYGAANAVYRSGDRTFSLSDAPQSGLQSGIPPTNPPTGTLEDAPVPEPGTLALLATGLISSGIGRSLLGRRSQSAGRG